MGDFQTDWMEEETEEVQAIVDNEAGFRVPIMQDRDGEMELVDTDPFLIFKVYVI